MSANFTAYDRRFLQEGGISLDQAPAESDALAKAYAERDQARAERDRARDWRDRLILALVVMTWLFLGRVFCG